MQCKPIVTYSLATVLVLWILLGAITLPNANRWFKGFGSSIEQDIVSFRLNQTFDMRHAIVEKEGHQSFHYNVFPITNTPRLPTHGLDGVLYDKGDACIQTTIAPNLLNTSYANISKVALIQQSSACYLVDKINHAEIDGALAVIVFHNDPHVVHSSLADMGVMPKKVSIPSYYIDYPTGIALLNNIHNLSHQPQQEGYSPSMVHVQLVPGKKPVLDHWQFGLVIVGIMLFTCILTAAILQCYMWRMARLGRHQHTSHETLTLEDQHQLEMNEDFWRHIMGDNTLPPPPPPLVQKQRLEQSLVDLLPIRIYKKKTSSVESLSHHCVICLDGFEQGHVLRRMPCQHEYHRDCIDTWLTQKNNTCPLCLQRIEIPTVPEQAHHAIPDLAQTWQQLEQASIRQYHSRSYSGP